MTEAVQIGQSTRVLKKWRASKHGITFAQIDDDTGSYKNPVGVGWQEWEAMGSPDVITVNIQPGDLLNTKEKDMTATQENEKPTIEGDLESMYNAWLASQEECAKLRASNDRKDLKLIRLRKTVGEQLESLKPVVEAFAHLKAILDRDSEEETRTEVESTDALGGILRAFRPMGG